MNHVHCKTCGIAEEKQPRTLSYIIAELGFFAVFGVLVYAGLHLSI